MNPARVATRVLPLALAIATGCAVAAQAQTAPWPSQTPQQPASAPWPSAQPAAPQQQPAGPWPSAQPSAAQQPAGPWPSAQPSAPAPMSMGPAPGPGTMNGPGPTPEQQKCLQEFTSYRTEVEKRAKAAEAESHKKPTREKMCELITAYSAAEAKWVKFAEGNMSKCGIPPQIVEQIKTVHVRTADTRKKVCTPGPTQAAAPATPSLSDALGASLQPNDDEEKKKHKVGGIMDTLTGPVQSR